MQSHIIICAVCCRSLLLQFLTAGFHTQVCETCQQFGSWQRPSLCLTEFGVLVFSCAEVRRGDWGVGERTSNRPEWPSSISRTGWGTLVVVEAECTSVRMHSVRSPKTWCKQWILRRLINLLHLNAIQILCVWFWKINHHKVAVTNGSLIINSVAYSLAYNTQAIEHVTAILAHCDSDTKWFP